MKMGNGKNMASKKRGKSAKARFMESKKIASVILADSNKPAAAENSNVEVSSSVSQYQCSMFNKIDRDAAFCLTN